MRQMTVAVVIPTVAISPFLRAAVESALLQDTPFNEVIVFGNGLRYAELKEFLGGLESRVRIHVCGERLPPHKSWNSAIEFVQSERAVFLGDDDLMNPTAGAILKEAAKLDKVVTFGYDLINSQGELLGTVKPPRAQSSFEEFYDALIGTGSLSLMLGGVLFSPEWHRAVGGFGPTGMSNGWYIDTECWLRLVHHTRGCMHEHRQTWAYRINSGQMGYRSDLATFEKELRQYLMQHILLARDLSIPERRVLGGDSESYFKRIMIVRAGVTLKNQLMNGQMTGMRWVGSLAKQRQIPVSARLRIALGCLKQEAKRWVRGRG